MNNIYDIIVRPIVTEKAVGKKDGENTLCFEVAGDATKTDIKTAVQKIFKVKVADVRTVNNVGKLRRRGRFSGFRSDWKKAYVRLRAGEKMPEYTEI
jgi:large subunit ribosomal protein L23